MSNLTANLIAAALGLVYWFFIRFVMASQLPNSVKFFFLGAAHFVCVFALLALAYYVDGFAIVFANGRDEWGWLWWGRVASKFAYFYVPVLSLLGWLVIKGE